MKRVLILLVLILSAGSVARASTLQFTLSGVENGSFTLDSHPTPNDFGANSYTKFTNLTFTDGVTTVNDYQLLFFSSVNGGSFSDVANSFGFFGPQVYSGMERFPVFAPGVFTGSNTPGGSTVETITITAVPAAVPEPASLLLTLTGFASTGFVGARRKWALRA